MHTGMNNSRPFQVPNLKLAVLDFLKRHCPDDRELFRLVCLHFSLFSEVADLWESEGRTLLAMMAQQGAAPMLLTNTEDTKQRLRMAMLSFTHAAEYFLQVRFLYLYIDSGHRMNGYSLLELLPYCMRLFVNSFFFIKHKKGLLRYLAAKFSPAGKFMRPAEEIALLGVR
jgi:hypothetical protein